MRFSQLVCPISDQKIDSNVSRVTVFLGAILIALYVVTQDPEYMVVLAIDYGIRAFWDVHYSLLLWLARGIVKVLRVPERKIDLAPKLFASRLGFMCAAASVVLSYSLFQMVSIGIAIMFLSLTLLDSVFNFCVGCLIYHYLVFPLRRVA